MTNFNQVTLRKILIIPMIASGIALSSCADQVTDPYTAGVQAFEEHDLQAARLYFQQALEAKPNNKDIQLQYAKVLLAMENPEGAIVQLEQLMSEPTLFPTAPSLLAKAHLLAGNPQAALDLLEKSGMSDGQSYAIAVGSHLNLGDADNATKKLDEGLSKFPNSAALITLDANRAFDMRDLTQARLKLGMALSKEPDNIEASMLGGRIELYDRQFSAARKHFENVLEVQSWNIAAMVSIAAMERDMGHIDEAKKWLEKTRAISPKHPIATYFTAQIAFDAGNIQKANDLIQSISGPAADVPAIWLLRGQISASGEQTNTAISEFERYFKQGGEGNTPRLQLAQLYQKAGENEHAWQILEPVLSSYGANEQVLRLGTELASELGKPDLHQIAERTRTLRDQKSYEAEMLAANSAIQSGDWETAGRIYSEILAIAKHSNPVVLNNAANVQLKLGNSAAAFELASRAYSLAPQDPIIMDTMGWSMLQAQGKSPRAIELIKQAFELAPNNREIADHLIIAGQGA